MDSLIATYKRTKANGKVSEQMAWTSIINQTSVTRDQLLRTEHTDTHWVFVFKRPPRRIHSVNKFKIN